MKTFVLAAILASVVAGACNAQDTADGFVARVHTGPTGPGMPYRLFIPVGQHPGEPLPLIVYLHGSGGAGTDNRRQISGGNTAGTHIWTTPALQAKHQAFVLVPQIPTDAQWSATESDALAPYAQRVLDLVARLSKEFAIDADRIYLVGQSLGGFGVWDVVSKRPKLFAAAVPLCGGGDATRVRAARDVAIWAFHGTRDVVVPVQASRDMVAALKSVGSSVRYTEYPEAGHDVWRLAFANPELPEWMFAQRRSSH
jgi:predicted peptidase